MTNQQEGFGSAQASRRPQGNKGRPHVHMFTEASNVTVQGSQLISAGRDVNFTTYGADLASSQDEYGNQEVRYSSTTTSTTLPRDDTPRVPPRPQATSQNSSRGNVTMKHEGVTIKARGNMKTNIISTGVVNTTTSHSSFTTGKTYSQTLQGREVNMTHQGVDIDADEDVVFSVNAGF